MSSPRLAALAGALALAGCAATPTATTAGHVAAEGRIFWQPPRYAGQEQGSGVSLVAEPELDVKSEDEVQELVARPYYRLDPYDSRRSHFDVRKASYRVQADGWEAGLGAGQFTWGALESHRPVDIVNQVDFVDTLDGSAKLGQPFVEVGYAGEVASLRLYYLPLFRERTFPGVDGRLRFAAPIDGENPAFEPDLGRWMPSGAARLALRGGDFDVGISAFSGLSREPRFVVELTRARVVPLYDLLQQGSIDAQWTHDALALKAEGFVRLWTQDFRPFAGGGAGAEYSFFDVVDGWDVTLVAEMLLDGRPLEAPPTIFEHDAFCGLRLGFNDTASTEILGGAFVDVLSGTTLAHIEAGRRFGDHWRASVAANLFLEPAAKPAGLESALLEDDHAEANLAYFF